MEVHQQNALFQYFADTLGAVIQEAKKNGRYDMGILGKSVFIQFFFSSVFTNTEAKRGRRFFGLILKVSTISEDLCLMSCIRSGLW